MRLSQEKRRYRRYRHNVEALVVLDEGLVHLPAHVLNATAFGAKMKLSDDVSLPAAFDILFDHRIERCRLIWRDGEMIGVLYED